jgi:hypothetical protein
LPHTQVTTNQNQNYMGLTYSHCKTHCLSHFCSSNYFQSNISLSDCRLCLIVPTFT